MLDTASATASAPPLYSQTQHDERGNFAYVGDLRRDREPLTDLCQRIDRHLATFFPETKFSVRGERFAGGRKVTVELLDASADLSDGPARKASALTVRDQVERFGSIRSNFYQDYVSCSFYSEVRIGTAYWAALAARRGPANPVKARVSLAAFKRRLKVGDRLKLIDAPAGHRHLGTARKVVAVRSADLILEGPSYLNFPRASGFACDGRRVRISIGNEYEPDRHLLYEWLPETA